MRRARKPAEQSFVVCTGDACKKQGADQIKELLEHYCPFHGRKVSAHECLGLCKMAPLLLEDGHLLPNADPDVLRKRLGLHA
jgi:NADH:ubiquinone oxidoreductase subunit E